MNTMERRNEVLNILVTRRHTTVRELMEEFDVSEWTIGNDIDVLSMSYPIYTLQGVHGGIFMEDGYNPHMNTLTPNEIKTLQKIHEASDEKDAKVISDILGKYGPKQSVRSQNPGRKGV